MRDGEWNVDVLVPGSWHGATSVLISDRRHNIVVDTGLPHEAHAIMKALELRGLKPTDIRLVINSHFHIDHVSNNTLFPTSEILCSLESYEWCRAVYSDLLDGRHWETLIPKYYPDLFDYDHALEMMGKLRKLVLRWWDPKRLGDSSQFRWIEKHPLPHNLESLVTFGHVPGHVSIIVHTGKQRTVIAGDAVLSRRDEEKTLTMIPHQRKQYQQDRARILAMQARILPGHDREFTTLSSEQ